MVPLVRLERTTY